MQAPFLEKLRHAAREHRQVDIGYQSTAKSDLTRRQVNPYALVHRTGWWYLVGYCHLRDALRTFRVDRIQNLEVLNNTFQSPDDFDIHAYLEDVFAEQPVIRAKLRFKSEGSHIARSNISGWETLHENPNGSVDVTITAPDLPWLASVSLSFANLVTVLEPLELRDMVRDWARSVVAQYETKEEKT